MKIHRSVAALALTVAACLLTTVVAQGEAPPAATQTLPTASYPLFPVDDSGVTGQLQVVAMAEGGAELILTMSGIEAGSAYTAAIYAGSCGPDRPVFLELEPVGRENDPYVSITMAPVSFEEITEGDHFVYVFEGEAIDRPDETGLDAPALACGEVGLGALEGQP